MQKSSLIAIAAAFLLTVAFIGFYQLRRPQPSVQEQIISQLETARVSVEHHDVRELMKTVSADYHGQTEIDSNIDQLHALLLKTMNNADPIEITLASPSINVMQDSAISVGRVTVRGSEDRVVRYDQTITLHWKREEGRSYLVIPVRVWRIIRADYPAPLE